jgi:phosphoribosyl 1,2-cyclic phosphodiesterase
MKVKFYGTRGSIAVCEPEFQTFGGNTTCIQLTGSDGRIAILDAGSGIRNLGKDLIASGHEQFENMYIGFSHFHWDHIQGFPYFGPAYDPRRRFTISAFGKGNHDKDLKAVFAAQMQEEYFPVSLDKMGASFKFQEDDNELFMGENVNVRVSRHCHPGGAHGYRMEESDGKVLVYITDVEHEDGIDPNVVELARGADVLIHDAQYTPDELEVKKGWGHSSWEQAIEVAEQAEVKRLVLTHHDPDHNDEFLLQVEGLCQERFSDSCLAREKMEIQI